MLGVEGIDDAEVIDAVRRVAEMKTDVPLDDPVTPAELYEAGLAGGKDSASRRAEFLHQMKLPVNLSTKQMLKYLNRDPGPDEFRRIMKEYSDQTQDKLSHEMQG